MSEEWCCPAGAPDTTEAPTPDLAAIDRDGAIREVAGLRSRAELLTGALAAAGALAAGLGLPAWASAKLGRRDVSILNFALSLEYLQDAFYTEAERMGALRGDTARAARVVGAVERAHVKAFRDLLGARAIARPAFDFHGTTEGRRAFLRTAVALEDLSVAAYKGQAPRVRSPDVLVSVMGVHSVEARHAAWMRRLAGVRPARQAFDRPRDRADVLRIVDSTGFVVQRRPQTQRDRRAPRFTG